MSLRARLALAFALVTLLPLVVLAVVLVEVLPARDAQAEQARLAGARDLVALELEETCRRMRTAAAAAAGAAAAGADLDAAATEVVRRGDADQVVVRDTSGTVLAAAPDDATTATPPGDCLTGPPPRADLVAARATIRAAGAVAPADAVTVSAGVRVDQELVQAWSARVGADVTVVGDGAVLGSTLPDDLAQRLVALSVPPEGAQVDDLLLLETRPRTSLPLALVSAQSAAGMEAGQVTAVVLVVTGVPLLAALLGWSLAGAVTRPLSSLVATAREVEQGRLDARVDVSGDDEVGRLGEAFQAMTARLRDQVEELRRNGEELRGGLARLGSTLSSSHDLDRIFEVALATAVEALRARAGAVLVVQDDGSLRAEASLGLPDVGVDPALHVGPGEGQVGAVAGSGRATLLPAPTPGGAVVRPRAEAEPDVGTSVLAPLVVRGRVLGVLALYDRRDGGVFGEGDLATLQTFAGQVAAAVANVQLHQEAQRLSVTDELTGLHNYRYLVNALGREAERSLRFGRPMAVLLLDLDHFKDVNDTFGHPRGDRVLRELADRLRSEVREVDTLARYGGEEVVAVLPETADSGARQTAERLRAAVSRRPFGLAGDEPVVVTVSIGIALFPQHGETADELLAAADSALYAAKSAGRDAWRVARGRARAGH